jgi:hypothetical protein
MSQGIQQSGVMFVSAKTSPASEFIFEEYLKKCMTRTTAQPFQPGRNTKAARMKHSPFGDFPKESMPKKVMDVDEPEPIDHYATSIAIKGNSKCFDQFYYILHTKLFS